MARTFLLKHMEPVSKPQHSSLHASVSTATVKPLALLQDLKDRPSFSPNVIHKMVSYHRCGRPPDMHHCRLTTYSWRQASQKA